MKTLFAALAIVAFFAVLQLFRSRRPSPSGPPPPAQSGMSPTEAASILGIAQDSSPQDVISAHRRLMQRVHPDKGGSAHLARQLNEAKRVLLKN